MRAIDYATRPFLGSFRPIVLILMRHTFLRLACCPGARIYFVVARRLGAMPMSVLLMRLHDVKMHEYHTS